MRGYAAPISACDLDQAAPENAAPKTRTTNEETHGGYVMTSKFKSITRRSAVLAAGAVALAAATSAPGRVEAQPKNVKIAVIVPMSGPWARQGNLVKFGAETAIAEINSLGGIKAMNGAKL